MKKQHEENTQNMENQEEKFVTCCGGIPFIMFPELEEEEECTEPF